MCLFTSEHFHGKLKECNEGILEWVPKEKINTLNIWEGDFIFLDLLTKDVPFFSLKLTYAGDSLTEAVLDGVDLIRK